MGDLELVLGGQAPPLAGGPGRLWPLAAGRRALPSGSRKVIVERRGRRVGDERFEVLVS